MGLSRAMQRRRPFLVRSEISRLSKCAIAANTWNASSPVAEVVSMSSSWLIREPERPENGGSAPLISCHSARPTSGAKAARTARGCHSETPSPPETGLPCLCGAPGVAGGSAARLPVASIRSSLPPGAARHGALAGPRHPVWGAALVPATRLDIGCVRPARPGSKRSGGPPGPLPVDLLAPLRVTASGFQELPSTSRPCPDPVPIPVCVWRSRQLPGRPALALMPAILGRSIRLPTSSNRRKSRQARIHIRCKKAECFPAR